MQATADYTCAVCFEVNSTFVDPSAGTDQSYTEDCQVCCRPNVLYVHVDRETGEAYIRAEHQE